MEIKVLKQVIVKLKDEDFVVVNYIDPFEFSSEEIKDINETIGKEFPNKKIITLPKDLIEMIFSEREDTIKLLRNLIKQLEEKNNKNEEK